MEHKSVVEGFAQLPFDNFVVKKIKETDKIKSLPFMSNIGDIGTHLFQGQIGAKFPAQNIWRKFMLFTRFSAELTPAHISFDTKPTHGLPNRNITPFPTDLQQ